MGNKPASEWHRLTNVRPEVNKATCSVCGPDTRVKYRRHRDEWSCFSIQGKRSPEGHRRNIQLAIKANRWRHVPGMTVEIFDRLMAEQDGCCAICGGTNGDRNLAADHCHATGRIRGLLCTRCNNALGLMRDDPERLLRAAEYISNSRNFA